MASVSKTPAWMNARQDSLESANGNFEWMLRHRALTQERLERGLWTANEDLADKGYCGKCCMIMGVLMMATGCSTLSFGECVVRHWHVAVQEVADRVLEVACDVGASAVAQGRPVHLTDCPVSGLLAYEPAQPPPGLETMAVFQNVLPTSLDCAWIKIRLRDFEWRDEHCCDENCVVHERAAVRNLHAGEHVAPDVKIGEFPAGGVITNLVPGGAVYVAPNYREFRGRPDMSEGGPDLGLNNMLAVGSGSLSTNGHECRQDEDVQIDFSCGNTSRVSVLAAVGAEGELIPWVSSEGSGYNVGIVVRNTNTTQEMIAALRDVLKDGAWATRFRALLLNFVGMWCFAFAPYAVISGMMCCVCCVVTMPPDNKEVMRHTLSSFPRALVMSLILSLFSYVAGFFFYHFPVGPMLAFLAVGLPILAFLAWRSAGQHVYMQMPRPEGEVEQ